MAPGSTLTCALLALTLAAPARGNGGDPKAESARHVADAEKAMDAGKTVQAIDLYWQALEAASHIPDVELRYATANNLRLRIAEVHLDAHDVDKDPGHLDAAQAVLDEYVKVRNPEELDRAQALFDEIDDRRHPPPATTTAPPPPAVRATAEPDAEYRPTSIARPMLIAGATLTALGGVATIAMVATLVVHNDASKDREGASTEDEYQRARQRKAAARAGAIASGVIAAAAFSAGIPLLILSVHKRRSLRVAATPAIGPRAVSLAIAGRF